MKGEGGREFLFCLDDQRNGDTDDADFLNDKPLMTRDVLRVFFSPNLGGFKRMV